MSDTDVDTPEQGDAFAGAATAAAAFSGANPVATTRLAIGFSWSECPRWHQGRFYFSDMYHHRILAVGTDGSTETIVDLSDRTPVADAVVPEVVPGGFGWLPDGRLIVTSMQERLVLAWDGERVTEYADLRDVAAEAAINDMVVDADGRAYITQLGFDLFQGADPVPSPLLVVEPDGKAHALTDLGGLMCGNGIALTEDGGTLVAVEAYGVTVLAFDRAADGTLSNRRTFATLPAPGDGMCLDADGAAWIASPAGGVVVRVTEGGTATDLLSFDASEAIPTSCVLGGEDRRTLYVTAGTEVFDWEKSRRESTGTVWTAPVAVGGGTARP